MSHYRSLLYNLLTLVTNGDKIVLEKLDSCITSSSEDSDDDDFAIRVDHKFLVDEDPRNLTLVKDLLNLPRNLRRSAIPHMQRLLNEDNRKQRDICRQISDYKPVNNDFVCKSVSLRH